MTANLTSESDRYGRSDMAVPPITYVRHAMPAVDEGVHPSEWHLDDAAKAHADGVGVPAGGGRRASAGSSPAPSRRRSRRPRRWRGDGPATWFPTIGSARPSGRGSDRATEPWRTATSAASCPTAGSRTPTSPSRMGAAVTDALDRGGGRAGRGRDPRPDPVDPPRRPAGRRLRPRSRSGAGWRSRMRGRSTPTTSSTARCRRRIDLTRHSVSRRRQAPRRWRPRAPRGPRLLWRSSRTIITAKNVIETTRSGSR